MGIGPGAVKLCCAFFLWFGPTERGVDFLCIMGILGGVITVGLLLYRRLTGSKDKDQSVPYPPAIYLAAATSFYGMARGITLI
jgi:Flp pilus assembly protein protease CpaA